MSVLLKLYIWVLRYKCLFWQKKLHYYFQKNLVTAPCSTDLFNMVINEIEILTHENYYRFEFKWHLSSGEIASSQNVALFNLEYSCNIKIIWTKLPEIKINMFNVCEKDWELAVMLMYNKIVLLKFLFFDFITLK